MLNYFIIKILDNLFSVLLTNSIIMKDAHKVFKRGKAEISS